MPRTEQKLTASKATPTRLLFGKGLTILIHSWLRNRNPAPIPIYSWSRRQQCEVHPRETPPVNSAYEENCVWVEANVRVPDFRTLRADVD